MYILLLTIPFCSNNSTSNTFWYLFLPRVFFLETTHSPSLFHFLTFPLLPLDQSLSLWSQTARQDPHQRILALLFRNKFIMSSLSRPKEETASSVAHQKQQSSILIEQLQAEIKHLQKELTLKDQTLEEIRKLVDRSLSPKEAIHSFDIVNKGLEQATISKRESGLRRSISHEISAQIDQNIGDSLSAAREEFNKIFRYHDSAIEVVNSQYQPPQDTPIPLPTHNTARVVEIPVEVRLHLDSKDEAAQVGLFESPTKKENENIGVSGHMDVYDVPVKIFLQQQHVFQPYQERLYCQQKLEDIQLAKLSQQNRQLKQKTQIQSIPFKQSQLLLQAEIKTMQKELQTLTIENQSLKEQLAHIQEETLSFEIQITTPYLTVPIDEKNTVEVPVELDIVNQAGSNIEMEIINDDEVSQQISAVKQEQAANRNKEQTRPNIVSDASLPQQKEQIQVRSQVSLQVPSSLNKQNRIIFSEHSKSNKKGVHPVIRKSENPVQKGASNIAQVPLQGVVAPQKIKQIEIPLQVIKYIQVPKQVIKYIKVPIVQVQEVEVYSIMPVQIETIVEKHIVHQIPLQIFIIDDDERQHETEKRQMMMLNSAVPEQKKEEKEEEVQIQVEIQLDDYDSEIGERVIEVERIVGKVQVQKIEQKKVQIQVQKIVYVDRPIEIAKVVQKIVEVPVEVIVQKLIEIETIVQRNKEIIIQKTNEASVEHNFIFQVPVELEVQQPNREDQHVEIDSPTVHLSLKNHPYAQPQKRKEEVVLIPIDRNLNEIKIDAKSHSSCSQIVVEIPYSLQSAKSVCDSDIQTDEIINEYQPKIVKKSSDQQIIDALTLLQSAQKPKESTISKVQILQIPMQVEMDYSEEVRKMVELKYRERINDLHNQYSNEIGSLHQMLQNLQRIIIEQQQVTQHLRDQLEHKALQEQLLNSKVIKLEQKVKEKEETASERQDVAKSLEMSWKVMEDSIKLKENQIKFKSKQSQNISASHQQLLAKHEQLKKVYSQLQNNYNQLLNDPPSVYEMTVQMFVKIQRDTVQIQTDDLTLPDVINVIELPIELQVVEKISQQDEVKSNSTTNNKYFKGYNEQELRQKLRAMVVRPEMMDHCTQTEKQITIDDLVDFQLRPDNQLNITEMFDNTHIIKDNRLELKNYKMYAQNDQSLRQEHLISGIESVEQYENIIDFKIYEYAVEVYPQPVIYEVPIKVFKELSISEVQTGQLDKSGKQILKSSNQQSKLRITPVFEEKLIIRPQNPEIVHGSPYETHNMIRLESQSADIREIVNIEMIVMDQNKFNDSRVIVHVEDNNEMHFEQIGLLREAVGKNSEIKQNYSQIYEHKNHDQVERYKSLNQQLEQENIDLKEQLEHAHSKHAQEIKRLQLQNLQLERNLNNYQKMVQQESIKLIQLSVLKQKEQQKLEKLEQLYEKLKNQNANYELSSIKEIDRLQTIINDKKQYIKWLKLQQHETKQIYQALITSLRTKLTEREECIQQLEKENQKRLTKIQQLIQNQDQLRQAVADAKQNSENNATTLYEQEFQRIKNDFEQEKRQLKGQTITLNQAIQSLKAELQGQTERNRQLTEEIHHLQNNYEELKGECSVLLSVKNEIEQHYVQNLKEFNARLHECREMIAQKDKNIKDNFEQKKGQLKGQTITLNQAIQSLKAELQGQTERNRQLTEEIHHLQNNYEELKGEYSVLLSVKNEIEQHYVQNLKEFNARLHECREMIAYKDKNIHQLQSNCEKTVEYPAKLMLSNPEILNQTQNVRMEYLSRKTSRQADDPRFITAYVHKLEKILLRYERIMAGNLSTIQELQEKVCEYLRDALEKEQEAETLYSKLVQYQCAMNDILVEKITLQIENKRMTKAFELSQRKVLNLGNKLIEAVGKRHRHDSEDNDYYYQ